MQESKADVGGGMALPCEWKSITTVTRRENKKRWQEKQSQYTVCMFKD